MWANDDDAGKIRGRTLYIAWVAAALSLIFLVPGILYWIRFQAGPLRCVYGDPTCSLTVATYLLVVGTGLAFIAAYRAARYAARALAQEQLSAIAIQPCRSLGHMASIELWTTFERDLQYVPPAGFDENDETYRQYDFEVISIGRSPIVDAIIPIIVHISDNEGNAENFGFIGSMPADGQRHVRIWVPKIFEPVDIKWLADDAKHGQERTKVVCHADTPLPSIPVYVQRFDAQVESTKEQPTQPRPSLPEKKSRRRGYVAPAPDFGDEPPEEPAAK